MSRKPTFTQDMNLPELIEAFGSDEKCRAYLEALRWPDGAHCPRCDSAKVSRIVKRNQFDCDSCRYQFSVTVGTIFHDTHLPLWKWFLAVYLVGESKKGISANQLKRMLKVSYKTAWYLGHRIRAAMIDDDPDPLRGIVEADETWMGHGGKNHWQSRKPSTPLTTVIGAVERGGEVRGRISNRRQPTKVEIEGFLAAVVADDASAIYTDSAPQYADLGEEDTEHFAVVHSLGQWVQGDVHTNTIEGIWSLFKRSLVGSYHHISVKHFAAYLEEMAFRYNNRENAYLFRDTLMAMVGAEPLEYADLTEEAAA